MTESAEAQWPALASVNVPSLEAYFMTGAQAAGLPGREADGAAASAVKAMQAEGRLAEARERYAELVGRSDEPDREPALGL